MQHLGSRTASLGKPSSLIRVGCCGRPTLTPHTLGFARGGDLRPGPMDRRKSSKISGKEIKFAKIAKKIAIDVYKPSRLRPIRSYRPKKPTLSKYLGNNGRGPKMVKEACSGP